LEYKWDVLFGFKNSWLEVGFIKEFKDLRVGNKFRKLIKYMGRWWSFKKWEGNDIGKMFIGINIF
jgi:hypothetical protein